VSSNRYPLPQPKGWFFAAYSDDLEIGQSRPLTYFGEDMVIFRTESGEVKLLEAYCPHMGAHLGYGIHEHTGKGGEIKGETIVCPFHGWRFNGDGVCEEVPYAKNMPPKVKDQQCLKSWPVQEKNQIIWFWHHPKGGAPEYDVIDIPETAADHPEWGAAVKYHQRIRTHVQDMAENGADPAHFQYVHGTMDVPVPEDAVFEGHRRSAILPSKMPTPRGVIDGCIEFENNGPGQSWVKFTGICDTLQQACVTPIDDEYVDVNFFFLQKRDERGEVPSGGVNEAICQNIIQQLREDTPIWEHKKYWNTPLLCDGDGPIAKFRKWYSQFYEDYTEEKQPEHTQRFLREAS
jgi:phenylpropionate dioxygenase-like ring-hydroxylating dioxygenase large terminal subunit